jgi:hypothetical protein
MSSSESGVAETPHSLEYVTKLPNLRSLQRLKQVFKSGAQCVGNLFLIMKGAFGEDRSINPLDP